MAKKKKSTKSSGRKKKKKPGRKPNSERAKLKGSVSLVKVEIPEGVSETPAYFRAAIGTTYISTPGLSIADLAKMPEYKDKVAEITLKRWAVEDQWVQRRKKFVEDLQTKIMAQLGSDLANVRIQQITEFQKLYDSALAKIVDMMSKEQMEFKSPEAALGSVTRMFLALDDQRAKLMEMVVPQVPKALEQSSEDLTRDDMHQALVPKLEQDEARDLIAMLLERRRNSMRSKMVDSGDLTQEDLHGVPKDSNPKPKKKRPPPKKRVK